MSEILVRGVETLPRTAHDFLQRALFREPFQLLQHGDRGYSRLITPD